MRNLFRLRVEAPTAYSNHLFTFTTYSQSVNDPRLAILAEWHDRTIKAKLEPVFSEFVRDFEQNPLIATPSAWLEDFIFAMDEIVRNMKDDPAIPFDFAVAFSQGRSLYLLFTSSHEPIFYHDGSAQPLESTQRIRVKDLLPAHAQDSELDSDWAAGLRLVRVFFEDEDQVVLCLPATGDLSEDTLEEAMNTETDPSLAAESAPNSTPRMVIVKDAAVGAVAHVELENTWPDPVENSPKDRVTMAYVAAGLVVLLFATALFGMWRWSGMGTPGEQEINAAELLHEKVDSQAQEPARVSSETARSEARQAPVETVAVTQPTINLQVAKTSTPSEMKVLWSKSHQNWITSSPRLTQGHVVYGGRDGSLYAVDPQGKGIWTYKSGNGIGASPEVDGTQIFCGNYGGRAFALRALDGLELWARDLGAKIVATPTVGKRLVFFATYDGEIVALEKRRGRVAWRHPLAGKLRCKPLVVRNQVIVISSHGLVQCLKQEDGTTLWETDLRTPIMSSPVQVRNVVVFGSKDGYVHALNVKDGSVAWRWKAGGAVNSSPATDGKWVFVGSSDKGLYALDAQTGKKVWSFQAQAAILSTPHIEDHKVYFTAYDRYSYVLDQKSGQLIAKTRLASKIFSSPLVHEGRIFFGSNDGTFYCLSSRI